MEPRSDLQRLLAYNLSVLDQGRLVTELYACRDDDFARHSGPHLRHVIEHYEAFLDHVGERAIDYDARARDLQVQRDPQAARARVCALQERLRGLALDALREPLAIHLRGGLAGEDRFVTFSSLGRELLFLASHAVHHYAMIRRHCADDGIALAADFGKAPATVHHERHH